MLKLELRQNFTIDSHVLEDVVDSLKISDSDRIIEVGPGKGVLTQQILNKIRSVRDSSLLSYEVDTDLQEDLESIRDKNKNFFNFKLQNFIEVKSKSGFNKCTGNIPYHISEPLFFKFIDWNFDYVAIITGIKFARKMNGEFPSKITTIAKYLFDSKIVKEYDKNIFFPKSKVDSGLIIMKRKRTFNSKQDELLSTIFANTDRKHLWLNKQLGYEQSQIGQIYHMDLDKLVNEIKSK